MKREKIYRPSYAFIGVVVLINFLFVLIFGLAFSNNGTSSSSEDNAGSSTSDAGGVPSTSSDERLSPCESSTSSNAGWMWQTNSGTHPSCSSPTGGINDQGWVPTMCEGDISSVRLQVRPGEADCMRATSADCGIPMHNFKSLDYDFYIKNDCRGIWAAPLWMTPHLWQWGAGSGEIDSLEFCPRNIIGLNFAGGGHQVNIDVSMIESRGHITVRKDDEGIVTITHCDITHDRFAQCPEPQYSSCSECQDGSQTFACWCNPGSSPPNIYGSGGCREGGDCIWTLVSDIWNGVSGDQGYQYCMSEVPEIGLGARVPNLNSECLISVERILLRGDEPDGRLIFTDTSPAYCDDFTV